MGFQSIQARILCWTGICIVITIALLLIYTLLSTQSDSRFVYQNVSGIVDKSTITYLTAEARAQASDIQEKLGIAIYTAHSLAQTFKGIKIENQNGDSMLEIGRNEMAGILKSVLEQHKDFIAIYSCWEPGGLDALDASYKNDTANGYDATGRFIPYYFWDKQSETIQLTSLKHYESTQLYANGLPKGAFYLSPKMRKQVALIDPHPNVEQVKTSYRISISAPIVHKEQFYGIVGVDIDLSILQEIAVKINRDLYRGQGQVAIISLHGILSAYSRAPEKIGQKVDGIFSAQWKAHFQKVLRTGELLFTMDEAMNGNIKVFMPIHFSQTATTWVAFIAVPKTLVMEDANKLYKALIVIGKKNLTWQIMVSGIITFISLFGLRFVARKLSNPIKQATNVADAIASGDLSQALEVKTKDEIGQLAIAMKKMTNALFEATRQANKIAEGDYNTDIEPRSIKDDLGIALSKMTKSLRQASQENERNNWFKTGQAELADQIRGDKDIPTLSRDILLYLACYLDAQVGTCYISAAGNPLLNLSGTYAITEPEAIPSRIKPGQGLAGEAFLQQKPMSLSKIPPNYIQIGSSLGGIVPHNILAFPFILEKKVKGVLELGFLHPITKVKIDFLKQVSENIAITINSAQERENIKHLLQQTQEQAQTLQIQQRELETAKKEIEIKAEELAASSQYKSEFLANMSHEIRTPMNAIIGLSELALNNAMPTKLKDYLEKINASAHSLLGIINDILDISKIEAGKLKIELFPFDLDDIIKNLATVLTLKTNEKGLELLFEISPDVPRLLVGDALRLNQILINLGNNAIKFTEEGHVIIRFERRKEDMDLKADEVVLQISVIDTGIGMTTEQLNRLFNPFTQADGSITRKYGGTGLGLTISKQLVEKMDGAIWVDSQAGVGSTFTFTLRLGLGKEQKKKLYAPPDELKSLRALVVDDNPGAREILCKTLANYSFSAKSVASGPSALSELEQANPAYDLILLDWKMPGMDGIETAKKIKSNTRLSKIPAILMITAHAREEVREQAKGFGLQGLLTKPVVPSMLFNTILEIFGKRVADQSHVSPKDVPFIKELDAIRGARILVVEDNAINQQIARELLTNEGFFVEVANNGLEAIKMLSDSNSTDAAKSKVRIAFDAVLMDLQMPEMDGYTATQKIRELETAMSIAAESPSPLPIVAMTADAVTGVKERVLATGMNDYVSKPIDSRKLFEALIKWIEPGEREWLVKTPKRSATTTSKLPEITGIDSTAGVMRIGGDAAAYQSLLKSFYKEHQQTIDQIQHALSKDDLNIAQQLAHTLNGVSGNMGANRLHEAAKMMELAISEKNPTAWEQQFDLVRQELDSILSAIAAWMEAESKAETTAPLNAPIDFSKAEQIIAELKALLEDDDTRALQVLKTLKQRLPLVDVKEQMDQMENQIDIYAFEEAHATLSIIVEKIKRIN